jgi:hypothetical protein
LSPVVEALQALRCQMDTSCRLGGS